MNGHAFYLKLIYLCFIIIQSIANNDHLSGSASYTHIFTTPGVKEMQITCSNFASQSANTTLEVRVQLSTGLTIGTDFVSAPVPAQVNFLLSHASSYTFTVDVTARCVSDYMGDGVTSDDETIDFVVTTTGVTHTHLYTVDVANVTAVVLCENAVSNHSYEVPINFRGQISGGAVEATAEAFAVNTTATFNVTVAEGSHVQTLVDYGDGTAPITEPADTSSSLAPLTWLIQHTYTSHGNYTLTVSRLFNEIYEDTSVITVDVVIQNVITDIVFVPSAPSILTPPADIHFTFSEGDAQATLTDLHCTFSTDPGTESWFVYVAALPYSFGTSGSSVADTSVPAFIRTDDVTLTVNATCHNLLTFGYDVLTTFDVIEDDIEILALDSNSPDWWENVTIITLVIDIPHSPVTYRFAMGDSASTVCELQNGAVSGAGCDIQVNTNTTAVTIELSYTYDTWGDFTVTVSLSNGHTEYDVERQVSISVLEWTCSPATISLPADVTSPNSRPIWKSRTDSFTVTVDRIDCMKSQEVAYSWAIYSAAGVQMTSAEALLDLTAAQLFLSDRLPMDYDTYYARATVTMVIDTARFGSGPAVESHVDAHFSYDPSPTIVRLDQNRKLMLSTPSHVIYSRYRDMLLR